METRLSRKMSHVSQKLSLSALLLFGFHPNTKKCKDYIQILKSMEANFRQSQEKKSHILQKHFMVSWWGFSGDLFEEISQNCNGNTFFFSHLQIMWCYFRVTWVHRPRQNVSNKSQTWRATSGCEIEISLQKYSTEREIKIEQIDWRDFVDC